METERAISVSKGKSSHQKNLQYWKHLFKDGKPHFTLKLNRPEALECEGVQHTHSIKFPEGIANSLAILAEKEGVAISTLLQAALFVLLSRHSIKKDILIGCVLSTPNQHVEKEKWESNSSAYLLRYDLSQDFTFLSLLSGLNGSIQEAINHPLPYRIISNEFGAANSIDDSLPFQIMFVYHEGEYQHNDSDHSVPSIGSVSSEYLAVKPDVDLCFTVMNDASDLTYRIQYNAELYHESAIQRLLDNFMMLATSILSTPESRLSRLNLLSPPEEKRILFDWKTKKYEHTVSSKFHSLFEKQVKAAPTHLAIEFDHASITYDQLNCQSNQLAAHLRKAGLQTEDKVGIYAQFSFELAIAFLAVHKAGGICVPLESEWPVGRTAMVLQDCQAAFVLTQEVLQQDLRDYDGQIICMDSDWEQISAESTDNLTELIPPAETAFIFYTSGSTGQPKGVVLTHQGRCSRLHWELDTFQLKQTDTHLLKVSIAAGVFVKEFYWPLLSGSKLVVVDQEKRKDIKYLIDLIQARKISVLTVVPTMLRMMIEDPGFQNCVSLQHVFCSGETLPNSLKDGLLAIFPTIRLHHTYGMTEISTAVYKTYDYQNREDPISIGRPADTGVYIVDQHLQLAPIGVTGELCISGQGLAQGYFNKSQLNREKFLINPFDEESNYPLFKTGDLAHFGEDGQIFLKGRLDRVVKLNGYYVDLGEVENKVCSHPGIREGVVVMHTRKPDRKQLVAYIVPWKAHASNPSVSSLQEFLRGTLPSYMVPTYFQFMDVLPRGENRKLNFQALPTPNYDRSDLGISDVVIAPENPFEQKLIPIWQQVLELEKVGTTDDFFELGGDSLHAVFLITKINEELNLRLPATILYDAPTIQELAKQIEAYSSQYTMDSQSKDASTPTQSLFMFGGAAFYLGQFLDDDIQVFGLYRQGRRSDEPLSKITSMAAYCVEEILRIQPEGPYFLGAFCYNGLVAFEAASQLQRQGKEVRFLAMIECYFPNSTYPKPNTFLNKLGFHLERTSEEMLRGNFSYLVDLLRPRWDKLLVGIRSLLRIQSTKKARLGADSQMRRSVKMVEAEAASNYVPKTYSGRLHLFQAKDRLSWWHYPDEMGWQEYASEGIELTEISGSHNTIYKEANVIRLAKLISSSINKLRTTK